LEIFSACWQQSLCELNATDEVGGRGAMTLRTEYWCQNDVEPVLHCSYRQDILSPANNLTSKPSPPRRGSTFNLGSASLLARYLAHHQTTIPNRRRAEFRHISPRFFGDTENSYSLASPSNYNEWVPSHSRKLKQVFGPVVRAATDSLKLSLSGQITYRPLCLRLRE
jgi:hypothetical protein